MTAVLVHEVPCRLRCRVQGLKHNSWRAERLRDRIAAVPGIVAASASPLTGSLIITHDGRVATRERIATALEAHGHPVLPAAFALAPAVTHFEGARARAYPLLRIVADTLLERLVERLVYTAFAAVI